MGSSHLLVELLVLQPVSRRLRLKWAELLHRHSVAALLRLLPVVVARTSLISRWVACRSRVGLLLLVGKFGDVIEMVFFFHQKLFSYCCGIFVFQLSTESTIFFYSPMILENLLFKKLFRSISSHKIPSSHEIRVQTSCPGTISTARTSWCTSRVSGT